MKKLSKTEILKKIHKEIDHLDEYVALGVISRIELTDMICRRHLLSAKHAIKYFLKNTKQNNDILYEIQQEKDN